MKKVFNRIATTMMRGAFLFSTHTHIYRGVFIKITKNSSLRKHLDFANFRIVDKYPILSHSRLRADIAVIPFSATRQ